VINLFDKNISFEKYFEQKLQEENEVLNNLSYTEEQLREIYYDEYERHMNAPELQLRMESQHVNYDMTDYYLPEKWEMPREGKLLYDDEELQRALKLIVFNLGVQKSLDVIPRQLIEKYLHDK